MIFHYDALDKNGDNISDYIDAPSESSARQKIRGQGLYLIRLEKHEVGETTGKKKPGDKKSRLSELLENVAQSINMRFSTKSVGLFSRQLATLLKAGLPLPTAIADIVEQIDNKHFRNVIADTKEKIEEGSSFSNALLRHRNIFNDMYINMVRVGENLGSLDQVMARLAESLEKRNFIKSKIQSALWYPGFMIFFSFVVVIFLMTTVIPKIALMYEGRGNIPLPTRIVISISDILQVAWPFIPVLIFGLMYLFKKLTEQEEGKRKVDEIKLKIPLVKTLYNKLIVYRFTQNLGILLDNNVDIIKSFDIVQKIVGNVIIEEKISEAGKMIKEGSSVSNALRKADFLPKLVLGMISAGEASDTLDKMLLNIGTVYESEIDLNVTSLTSLLEPIIIVLMGAVIGMIFISVMMPIMQTNLLVQ